MSKKEISSLKKDLTPKFVIDSLMQKGNITYESLQPFPQNFDFIQLLQKLKEIVGRKEANKKALKKSISQPESQKPVDWTMQLAVINYLRRLFKFEKEIFNQAFYGLKFYENIIDFFNSIRSILAQNALILMNEVFSEYIPVADEKNQKAPIINLIKKIIPALILKANTSQSFIKNEAKACLETMVTNMKYDETLIALLQLMNTKKISDFELTHFLSIKLIKNLGKEFLVNCNQFLDMISALGEVYNNNKSDLYKKKCKSILNTFIEIMTKEEFDKKLEKCGKKAKEQIKEIIEERIRPNTKKEIHHNFVLKSKDKDKKKNNEISKNKEIPKNNCNTKPLINKKSINIKLVDAKIQNKKEENCENNCNNENIQNVKVENA